MRIRFPLLLSVAMLAGSGLAFADSSGRTGFSGNPGTGGRSCDTCHFGGTTPTVDMSGPMTVTPASTNTYTLTISGGQSAWGGVDISATAGALAAITGEGTKISGGEIVHSAPRAAVGGTVTFRFNWTAPSTAGSAALYGAGLSADGNGSPSGDAVDLMALMIAVENTPPPNQPPVAVPGGPYTGSVGASIAFDGSGSYDPDGTVVAYDWAFGDGTSGTGVSPTHAYAGPGAYTVSLTVTDDAGATHMATTVANVNNPSPLNQPPIADAGGPYIGLVGTAVDFDGSASSDPDGTIVSYAWNFGDGSTGTGPNPSHTYTAPAAYTVTLTVTDDQGASASGSSNAVVRDSGTPSLLVLVRARRVVRAGSDRDTTVRVIADLSSLPAGSASCGTATLYKSDQLVGTQTLCIEQRSRDDEDREDDSEESENSASREGQRTMRMKTAHGAVSMARLMSGPTATAVFEVPLGTSDTPSVVWTAVVDIAGYTGESDPVTTRVVDRTH